MGLPNVTSNYKGYEESDVFKKVEHLRNKMYYLVHGTADDNVQFQQSMALAGHLAKKGILFRQQVRNQKKLESKREKLTFVIIFLFFFSPFIII